MNDLVLQGLFNRILDLPVTQEQALAYLEWREEMGAVHRFLGLTE